MSQIIKYTCLTCGHSPDWHSFKDNTESVTDPNAWFTCNGVDFMGCDVRCLNFTGRAVRIVGDE